MEIETIVTTTMIATGIAIMIETGTTIMTMTATMTMIAIGTTTMISLTNEIVNDPREQRRARMSDTRAFSFA